MHWSRVFASLLLSLCLVTIGPVYADDVIVIPRERAERLFSYPINEEVTLEQTILLWLSEALRRDGFTNTNLRVNGRGSDIEISFVGPGASIYAARLPKFLDIGEKAYAGVVKLQAAKQWRAEWRFLLPLGLPIAKNKSVQLLHFPPIAVHTCFQDYLKVPTTKRWAELLAMNDASGGTDLYQAIVDIAPIAAPESAGEELAKIPHIYDETFKPYIDALIKFWAASPGTPIRPMVAFGRHARDYISFRYLENEAFPVLGYKKIKLDDGTEIAALGANHPSKFYFAVAEKLKDKPHDIEDAVESGESITQADLVAACWQVQMAAGNADGEATLKRCKDKWDSRKREICQTAVRHGREPNPPFPALFEGHGAEAAKVCN